MLISDPTDLMPFIPNAVRPAMGDASYFEKILPYIHDAEQWAAGLIASEDMADCRPEVRAPLREAVATQALHVALPLLDIVITPNGIATVGSGDGTAFVPASQFRTEAARASLLLRRDRAICSAVSQLRRISRWRVSEQGRRWGATLFPDLGGPLGMTDSGDISLATYLRRAEQVKEMEAELADNWISQPLMEVLRSHALAETLSQSERDLTGRLRTEMFRALRSPDGEMRPAELTRAVQLIRSDRSLLAYWEGTPTADRFRLPGFTNTRQSSGYFF